MVPLKSRAFAIQEEKNNRRKLRILQVRQQERAIASRVRENVENHKKQEIQSIAEKLHEEFALQNDVEISKSKEKYSKGLSEVGKAQNLAKDYVMEHALYQVNQIKNKRVADQRYNAAIQHMHTVEEMKQQKEQENKDRRIKVAVKEKLRSKQVAMLPSRSVSQDTENSVTTTVQTTVRSCDTFCATMNEEEGDNAREAARDEEETQEKLEQGKLCMQTVQQERAQLRYLSAIKRSKLNRDYNHLEKELQVMLKKDAYKRKELVSCKYQLSMPPNQQLEYQNDKQRHLEQTFVDAFATNQLNTTLDITVESENPVQSSNTAIETTHDPPVRRENMPSECRLNAANRLIHLLSKQQTEKGVEDKSIEDDSIEKKSKPTEVDDISGVTSSCHEYIQDTTDSIQLLSNSIESLSHSSVPLSHPSESMYQSSESMSHSSKSTSNSSESMSQFSELMSYNSESTMASIKDYQKMLLMKHSSSSRNDDQLDYPPPTKHSPQKVKTTTIFEKPPLPKQQLPTELQKEMMLNKQKVPQDMPVVLQNELSNGLGGLDKISDDIARREDELRRHQHHLDECQARLLKQQAHQVKLLSTLDDYSVEATIGAKPNPQRRNFKQDYTPQPSSINFIKQSIPDVRPWPVYKRSSKPPVVQPPVPLQVDIVQHDLSTIQEAEIENSQIVSANQSLATLLNRSDASVTNPLSTISEELTRVEKQMSTVQESLDFMRNNFSKKIPQEESPKTTTTHTSSENTWGGLLSSEQYVELPPQKDIFNLKSSLSPHNTIVTSEQQIAAAAKITKVSPGIWKEKVKNSQATSNLSVSLDSIKELLQKSSYIPIRQPNPVDENHRYPYAQNMETYHPDKIKLSSQFPLDQQKLNYISLDSIDRIKLSNDLSQHSDSITSQNSFTLLDEVNFDHMALDSISINTKSNSSKSVTGPVPMDDNLSLNIQSFGENRSDLNKDKFRQIPFTYLTDKSVTKDGYHILKADRNAAHTSQQESNDSNLTIIDECPLEECGSTKQNDFTHHSISEHSLSAESTSTAQSINITSTESVSKLLEQMRLARVNSRTSLNDPDSDDFKELSVVEVVNTKSPDSGHTSCEWEAREKDFQVGITETFREPSFIEIFRPEASSKLSMSSSSNGQLALKQNETIWNESIAEIHGIMEEEELTLLETTTSDTEESFREFSQINVLMSDFESMLELQEQSVSSDNSTAQDTINVLEA